MPGPWHWWRVMIETGKRAQSQPGLFVFPGVFGVPGRGWPCWTLCCRPFYLGSKRPGSRELPPLCQEDNHMFLCPSETAVSTGRCCPGSGHCPALASPGEWLQ